MIAAPPGSPVVVLDVVRQVNEALARIENPKKPVRLPVFALADLPDPAQFKNSVALLDTSELVTSDGVAWLLYDGGTP